MGIWRPLKVFVLNIEGLSVRLMLTKRYLFKLGNSQMKCCELPHEALISTLPHPSLNLTWNCYLSPRKQNDLETQMTGKWNCRGYNGSVKPIPFYSNDGMWIWKSTFSNLSEVLFLKTHRKQNSSSLLTITIWESCKNKFGDQLPVSSKHHN